MIGHQVWGTFAVSDHVVERAFVADVLLYDRLVVPIPTPDDVDRWEMNDWQPDRLRSLLAVLGDPKPDYRLAVEVPWGLRHRAKWEERWQTQKQEAHERARVRFGAAEAVSFDDGILKRDRAAGLVDPLHITRELLYAEGDERRDREFFERQPEVTVESVAAYPSYARFEEETGIADGVSDTRERKSSAGLIGWKFFVPKDDTRSDEELLAQAVELARQPRFQQRRADFHELRRKTTAQGGGDRELLARLERGLDEYQEEMRNALVGAAVRWAFWLGGVVTAGVGMHFGSLWTEGTSLAVGHAPFLVERLLPMRTGGEYSRAAAMVHDARLHFDWKD